MISLSFTVYSNKGAHALLLGSGVSSASGIPTGWEVVLDLIRKAAKLEAANWPPLKAGLFGGSLEQAKTAKKHFDQFLGYFL